MNKEKIYNIILFIIFVVSLFLTGKINEKTYHYVDMNGNEGYSKRCSNFQCVVSNKFIPVKSYELIDN